MVELSLNAVSSFSRDLSATCTAISLEGFSLVVGSQDGLLISWDTSTGAERWRVSIDGPISDISRDSDYLYVVASSSLFAISETDGSIIWSRGLEGASDYVLVADGSVWATSSVYEIEIGDYTESTIWRFDTSGELEQRWTIAERGWFFGSDRRGLVLGLGRPRCGVLRIDQGNLEHLDIPDRGPVTCGHSYGGVVLLGHSDGWTSMVEDLDCTSWLHAPGSVNSGESGSPVCSVLGHDGYPISGLEDGETRSNGGWNHSSNGPVAALSLGPHPSDDSAVWVCSSDGVVVLNRDTGDNLLELAHECRVVKCDSSNETIVLADERGGVYSINADFLARRVKEGPVENDDDDKTTRMRERLKKLRE